MNKYAEIQNRVIMYRACRGILRVKLAAAAATGTQPQQPAANTTAPAANTTAPAANNNQQQQDPNQQQAGMGGIGRSLGNTLQEYITGGTYDPSNSAGGNWGEKAMGWAGKGFNAATKWMSGKKGWVGAVGSFLNKNQDKLGNVVAGANEMLGGTNSLQGTVRANNAQKAMTAQQQAQENEQFNPDQMFAQSMQMMANMGQGMYQPQQYSGSTYRPSFA